VGLQEGLQEGRSEEGRSFVLRLLNRRVGTIAPELKTTIEALTIVQLEDLGEALLDFSTIVSNQSTFVNLIYDFETKLTRTMLRPQSFLTINLVNLFSMDPMLWRTINVSTTITQI